MFDIKYFEYHEKEHLGFYKGVLVPSATQLIGIAFPLGNIPQGNLEKASVRGTVIHEMVEEINKCDNYEEQRKLAYGTGNKDLINYTRLLKTFNLRAVKCEELVFLLDEDGELICYGHYDMILQSYGQTDFSDYGKNYMFDLKTVAEFEDEKVKLQTEIYRTAYNQRHPHELDMETGGIHLRDEKAKIHFWEKTRTDSEVISICKQLKVLWKEERERNDGNNTNL